MSTPSYDGHGQVAPVGELRTCNHCGTLVRAVRQQHHDAWHVRIEALEAALEALSKPKPRGAAA